MELLPSPARLARSAAIRVSAGELIAEFEVDSGMLRTVRFRGREILRGIYGAVRDARWNMVANTITLGDCQIERESFQLAFEARCSSAPIEFRWRGTVRGAADSTIEYQMIGEAFSGFDKNRIGLCVLHPISLCAGQRCRVETLDGQVQETAFPLAISPWQPFRRVRSISFPVGGATWLTTTFEGDTFETEDQRNWSDASYKTYSTPLDEPFPVRIAPGFRVNQQVTVRLESRSGASERLAVPGTHPPEEIDSLHIGAEVVLPRIGLCAASDGRPATAEQQRWLRSLRLDHLRVDLRMDASNWRERVRRAIDEATDLGTTLHLALHVPPNKPAEQLSAALSEVLAILAGAREGTCLLFGDGAAVTPSKLLTVARLCLTTGENSCRLAVGTDLHFAELNRHRPVPSSADFFTFGLTPQVHLSDTRTIVESLEVLAQMIGCVQSFSGSAQVMVSPVTLRPRKPEWAGLDDDQREKVIDLLADARQATSFAAAWTLGSLVELARGGAASVTYYETTGPLGVMSHGAGGSATPLATGQGEIVYPLYHLFADLAELSVGRQAARVVDCRAVAGFQFGEAEPVAMLLANLSEFDRTVRLPPSFIERGRFARIRELSDTSARRAAREPDQFREQDWRDVTSDTLEMRPWSYVRIEERANG